MNPKPQPIRFYQVARLNDGKERVWLVACGDCGAVVVADHQQHHEMWHRKMTDDLITGLAAAAKTAENRIRGVS